VALVGASDTVNPVNGPLVPDMTAKCVTGIRRIGYQPTISNNLDDAGNASRLRIDGVNFNELGHARIVGTWLQDARPKNTVLCRPSRD